MWRKSFKQIVSAISPQPLDLYGLYSYVKELGLYLPVQWLRHLTLFSKLECHVNITLTLFQQPLSEEDSQKLRASKLSQLLNLSDQFLRIHTADGGSRTLTPFRVLASKTSVATVTPRPRLLFCPFSDSVIRDSKSLTNCCPCFFL